MKLDSNGTVLIEPKLILEGPFEYMKLKLASDNRLYLVCNNVFSILDLNGMVIIQKTNFSSYFTSINSPIEIISNETSWMYKIVNPDIFIDQYYNSYIIWPIPAKNRLELFKFDQFGSILSQNEYNLSKTDLDTRPTLSIDLDNDLFILFTEKYENDADNQRTEIKTLQFSTDLIQKTKQKTTLTIAGIEQIYDTTLDEFNNVWLISYHAYTYEPKYSIGFNYLTVINTTTGSLLNNYSIALGYSRLPQIHFDSNYNTFHILKKRSRSIIHLSFYIESSSSTENVFKKLNSRFNDHEKVTYSFELDTFEIISETKNSDSITPTASSPIAISILIAFLTFLIIKLKIKKKYD
jgi:hypothetical protein